MLLVDGLGDQALRERAGHAPFLRSLLAQSPALHAGFPTTTATSMGSLGTGRPSGAHGLVGYEVLVPERDDVLNEPVVGARPRRRARVARVAGVARVGRRLGGAGGGAAARRRPAALAARADGAAAGRCGGRRGRAHRPRLLRRLGAHRGGPARWPVRRRRLARRPGRRGRDRAAVGAARAGLRLLGRRRQGRARARVRLVGVGDELEAVDLAVRRLVAGMPRDATLHVTADHGMVDVPHAERIDLAAEPDLLSGVRHLGGEARSPQALPRARHGARGGGHLAAAARRLGGRRRERAAARRGGGGRLVRRGVAARAAPHR
nr:alkaline phosphatase family protein [Angustibacter aerolatus]